MITTVSCTLYHEPLFCTAKYFTATNMNFRKACLTGQHEPQWKNAKHV